MSARSTTSSRPDSASDACGRQYVGSATNELLKLLATQKQEHHQIAKDPIFQEYHAEVKRKQLKLRRHGWKEPPRPQMDDDLDAEAQQRVMSLMTAMAHDTNRPLAGVWARFGKPYRPLGEFQQVCMAQPACLPGRALWAAIQLRRGRVSAARFEGPDPSSMGYACF